ncbi:hypothetical protein CEXT_148911 [Caerostris extrusa]|uniref:Uncharacterized protein n=1 Tax=Caerostris extrusa TaxID=172846 RepID=A0AAV4QIT3_CAEEX|nr:hypothetical protein CEXT_148911 [Caerostris extrusa]
MQFKQFMEFSDRFQMKPFSSQTLTESCFMEHNRKPVIHPKPQHPISAISQEHQSHRLHTPFLIRGARGRAPSGTHLSKRGTETPPPAVKFKGCSSSRGFSGCHPRRECLEEQRVPSPEEIGRAPGTFVEVPKFILAAVSKVWRGAQQS